MKKSPFLLILAMVLSGVGCNKIISIPAAPVPAPIATSTPPAATPTPNLTPVCGMTPVSMPLALYPLADSGIQVIQNSAQWSLFTQPSLYVLYLTPVPTPTPPVSPVNFATQMLVTAGMPEPCDNSSLTITNVCEGPGQVTVYATLTSCTTCPQCNVASEYAMVSAVAVPQSNLPVSIVYTYTNVNY